MIRFAFVSFAATWAVAGCASDTESGPEGSAVDGKADEDGHPAEMPETLYERVRRTERSRAFAGTVSEGSFSEFGNVPIGDECELAFKFDRYKQLVTVTPWPPEVKPGDRDYPLYDGDFTSDTYHSTRSVMTNVGHELVFDSWFDATENALSTVIDKHFLYSSHRFTYFVRLTPDRSAVSALRYTHSRGNDQVAVIDCTFP